MPIYNKLVRDQILTIIEGEQLAYNARILAPEEHLVEIKRKLYEEVAEFDKAETVQDGLEELADILELVHAALQVQGKTFTELEALRVQKKEKRGGFEQGIYLIDVEDRT